MAIRCGFFNSVDNDRLYTADEMTRPYELLVSNGVFATPLGTPSNYLQVYAESNLSVRVKAGRGIFFDKWFLSDSDIVLNLTTAEATLKRIDSVIVKVDKSELVRGATIEIKKGTPSNIPVPPVMTRTDSIHEYRLADILVNARATIISQADITDTRGLSDCGWVTSLIQQLDTSTLYEQWQAGFDAWFNDVKETLATSTLIRSYNSTYLTTVQDETTIPIQINQYNRNLDILQVYINGLMLIKDVEYTITDNEYIELEKGVDTGTPVAFVVYKSIDGSDAETVVSQVVDLQNNVDKIRLTSLAGGVKRSLTSGDLLTTFKSLGVGFHTMLASNAVTGTPTSGQYWRCFGHMTDLPYGWIVAISGEGRAYINFANGSTTWTGWKEITNGGEPTPLYKSDNGVFPNMNVQITPTKPLSQCEHGWELMFCSYDDTNKVAQDIYIQTFRIPKKCYTGEAWAGQSIQIPLTYLYNSDSGTMLQTCKRFNVRDSFIVSEALNAIGTSRNMVLRAIYEY